MIQQFIITYKQTINMVLILIDNNVLQMPDKKIKLSHAYIQAKNLLRMPDKKKIITILKTIYQIHTYKQIIKLGFIIYLQHFSKFSG